MRPLFVGDAGHNQASIGEQHAFHVEVLQLVTLFLLEGVADIRGSPRARVEEGPGLYRFLFLLLARLAGLGCLVRAGDDGAGQMGFLLGSFLHGIAGEREALGQGIKAGLPPGRTALEGVNVVPVLDHQFAVRPGRSQVVPDLGVDGPPRSVVA